MPVIALLGLASLIAFMQAPSPWVLFVQTETAGVPEYQLPDAGEVQGQVQVVKVPIGRASTRMRSQGQQDIDGQSSQIVGEGETLTVQAAGSGWLVINRISASAGGGYNTIEDEGVPLAQRTTLGFAGAGVSCTDVAGETVCTVGGGAPTGYQEVYDEGLLLTARTAINFTQAGITCFDDGLNLRTECQVPSGGNFLEVSVAMTDGTGFHKTTVTGQAWVTANSRIVCSPFGTTADGVTADLAALGNFAPTVSDRVVGDGFTLTVFNAYGVVGTFRFNCVGN